MTNDNKQDKDPKNAASSEAVTENVKITNYVKCKCKSSTDRITYGDVEKAIKQLAATGIEINSNTIRDHLKHGSFSTIIKHMNTYLTKELATTAELEFTQNGMEECKELAEKLVQQAFIGNIKTCRQRIAQAQKEHNYYKKLMTTEVDAVANLNSTLEAERDALKEKVATLTDKLNKSEQRNLEAITKTENLEAMLTTVKQQNEELLTKIMKFIEKK